MSVTLTPSQSAALLVKQRMIAVAARYSHQVGMGLKKAGLFIQRESQLIVPVDLSFLKPSAFTRAEGEGAETEVTVGYTSAYAIYVHENLDAAHGAAYNAKYAKEIAAGWKGYHTRGPNQSAKFLEKPIRENLQQITRIVVDESKK